MCGRRLWQLNSLSPFTWIRNVHPEMMEFANLVDFWCTAWVWNLDDIPGSRDLWIVEPLSVSDEAPPRKKALVYPITIRFSVITGAPEAALGNAERRVEEDDTEGHSGLRQEDGLHSRGCSWSPSADDGGGQAEPAGVTDRCRHSVHEQLGNATGGSGCTPHGSYLDP
jgi:hypothetical protein